MSSSPPGIDGCAPTASADACSGVFAVPVLLRATPDRGSVFAGFTGAGAENCGTGASCTVSVDEARIITALFDANSTLSAVDSVDGHAQLCATLTNAATGGPLRGQTVTFTAPDQNGVVRTLCTATTNARGVATCNGGTFGRVYAARPGTRYTAAYAGSGSTLATRGDAKLATPRTR